MPMNDLNINLVWDAPEMPMNDLNIHLVIAAPDLYVALRQLVDGINDEWHPLFFTGDPLTSDERHALERAEAALAKAEAPR